jgi:hypothetical protein
VTGKEKEKFLHRVIFLNIYRSSRFFLGHPVVLKMVNKFRDFHETSKVYSGNHCSLPSETHPYPEETIPNQ